ncbi:hypothetical protein [Streptomyces pseudovenezuelae]|uniref:Alkylation response protein AidB-like acyl-CoA dehydrogenase n=1 Tax=Streptomyces pseudovenezuelae TaxID=67350 RepID=A0ABT6LA04_9ACTN|nr:alkylation response protein AidB-like acyl-CoA dehydrogenase [Streptomyces pseudovenezuelae]
MTGVDGTDGTEQQKAEWVRPLAGPNPLYTALAPTEPEAGSDAGRRAAVCREIFFDEVFVPESDRLGDEGQDFRGLMRTFPGRAVDARGQAGGDRGGHLEHHAADDLATPLTPGPGPRT